MLYAFSSAVNEDIPGIGAESVKRYLRGLKIVGEELLKLARDDIQRY